MKSYDVIIIGAGAAGMMCAIEAGRRGKSVLLVDHAKSVGEKIRISGGGRCNFTNLNISGEKFLSQNPRFALSCLARYTQWDFIDLIARNEIAYHEKTLGQLFCDGSAKQIISLLEREMHAVGVHVSLNTSVLSVLKPDRFEVDLSIGKTSASSLVIASGGKSIPKMGATGFGYNIAQQFGLNIIETLPALVPLTFAQHDLEPIKKMAGSSVFASVSCNHAKFDEGFLFTHRGISGPSILQISSYWREGAPLSINLYPKEILFSKLKEKRHQNGRIALRTALAEYLPKSISDFIEEQSGLSGNLADQSDVSLQQLCDQVHKWHVVPIGSEGYRTAEVTLGGVDTGALDAKTMQAKNVPGLFFIGEVVDVTGWLGGYNFQWAWSSGWAAGQAA